MTADKRNFWIILTTIAVLLAAANFLKNRSRHSPNHDRIQLIQSESKSCQSWDQNRYNKSCKSKAEARKERRELIQCKRKKRKRRHHHETVVSERVEMFLPDQPPVLRNYGSVLDLVMNESVEVDGIFSARIQVNESGKYVKHEVLRSDHPQITRAVEKHIGGLVFVPAKNKGELVAAWVNVPFRFRSSLKVK